MIERRRKAEAKALQDEEDTKSDGESSDNEESDEEVCKQRACG